MINKKQPYAVFLQLPKRKGKKKYTLVQQWATSEEEALGLAISAECVKKGDMPLTGRVLRINPETTGIAHIPKAQQSIRQQDVLGLNDMKSCFSQAIAKAEGLFLSPVEVNALDIHIGGLLNRQEERVRQAQYAQECTVELTSQIKELDSTIKVRTAQLSEMQEKLAVVSDTLHQRNQYIKRLEEQNNTLRKDVLSNMTALSDLINERDGDMEPVSEEEKFSEEPVTSTKQSVSGLEDFLKAPENPAPIPGYDPLKPTVLSEAADGVDTGTATEPVEEAPEEDLSAEMRLLELKITLKSTVMVLERLLDQCKAVRRKYPEEHALTVSEIPRFIDNIEEILNGTTQYKYPNVISLPEDVARMPIDYKRDLHDKANWTWHKLNEIYTDPRVEITEGDELDKKFKDCLTVLLWFVKYEGRLE